MWQDPGGLWYNNSAVSGLCTGNPREKGKFSMIQITDKTQCCGCTACVSVCPQNCITMQRDGEGFAYPVVDASLCVGCDACEAVCPCQNRRADPPVPEALAVRAKDDILRLFSSSGGVFSLLSTDMLARGGAVCGAVYGAGFAVQHAIAWDEAGVEAMRGAKYVQSDLGDTFRQIRDLVDNGTPVLFSGTPCQTDGLGRYLGPDAGKVLRVAVVCHGVPSPKIWEKNLRELGEVTDVRLRDKRHSWKHYATNYFVDGKEVLRPVMDDPYMKGFLRDLYLRPSCTDCPAKTGGYADLTLGDFWGIEKIKPEMDDDKGVSLVLVQTEQGRQAMQAIAPRVLSEPVTFAQGTQYNPAVTASAHDHPQRAAAWQRFESEPLARVVADYTKESGMDKLRGLARRLLGRR